MTNQLHYRGDVTDIDPHGYVGADMHGAFYRPVSATYDAELDRTTIQYRPIAPADMPTYADRHSQMASKKADLIRLFGGRWVK